MKQKRSFKIGVAGTLLTVGLLTAAFTTRTASESVRVMDRPDECELCELSGPAPSVELY